MIVDTTTKYHFCKARLLFTIIQTSPDVGTTKKKRFPPSLRLSYPGIYSSRLEIGSDCLRAKFSAPLAKGTLYPTLFYPQAKTHHPPPPQTRFWGANSAFPLFIPYTTGGNAKDIHEMVGYDSFMTMAEFEGMVHDPQTILDRAGQYLNYLEQQQQALEEESKQQQGLRAESGKINYTPEQHASLVEHSAELELDHRDLSQKYVDLEHINNTIQGVVDALRADKQRLLDELAVLKEEQGKQVAGHTRLLSTQAELEELREGKGASLVAHNDEINQKIRELQEYSDKVIEGTGRVIELQDHTEKVGSGRLALESETTALEQSTQQQERTIAYLQQELMFMDNEIKKKADETVALKKQMSSTILELQLQITKNEEEMSRIRTTVANEKDLTGRQNVWLAKDLQAKNQELLLARQQMTTENSDLKHELVCNPDFPFFSFPDANHEMVGLHGWGPPPHTNTVTNGLLYFKPIFLWFRSLFVAFASVFEINPINTSQCLLREKAARMKSNVYVMERRNELLHDDLQRLEAQDQFMKVQPICYSIYPIHRAALRWQTEDKKEDSILCVVFPYEQ